MRSTGRSFREALTELRLEAARQAFAANGAPRQTIADIAISVGFNDLSQFNRHFRNAYGMTPRAARRLDEVDGYPRKDEAGAASPAGTDASCEADWLSSATRSKQPLMKRDRVGGLRVEAHE